MTVREYLMQSLKIRGSLSEIEYRIEKLKTDLEYHPVQLDDSGASHLNYREDKFSEKMAEIADIETEWMNKRAELEKQNDEIIAFIDQLDNAEYISVLKQRYIVENKRNPARLNSWVAIAFKLGMTSEEAVKQKHKRAIRSLEKKYSEKINLSA